MGATVVPDSRVQVYAWYQMRREKSLAAAEFKKVRGRLVEKR